MSTLLKGAPVAKDLMEGVLERASALLRAGTVPTLALIRIGNRPEDISYETGIEKRCAQAGVRLQKHLFTEDVTEDRLLETVNGINADPAVHGAILLLPFPAQIDGEATRCALLPEKDMDGITDGSLAGVFAGVSRGYAPCTAQACMSILAYYGVHCTGKRAVVIGRSLVVGRPAAMLLLHRNATVTICHTRTENLPAIAREADILIVAAGRPGVVGKECFRPGQTVIDVGVHPGPDGTLCGDVRFDEAEPVVEAITPVPGGVGAVTTAVLISHVIEAAECANSLRETV